MKSIDNMAKIKNKNDSFVRSGVRDMYSKTEKTIKIKTVLISCIIALAISFCLCGTAAAEFAGGNGSEEEPYQIKNADQLKEVSDYLTSNFTLTDDIQITDSEWAPIGNYMKAFTGTFDGNNHSIIFTKETTFIYEEGAEQTSDSGLFGTVKFDENRTVPIDPFIRNLKIVMNGDFLVVSGPFGAVAGNATKTLIENCSVEGENYTIRSVDGSSISRVGGLIGRADGSEIKSCSATPEIVAENEAGGLIGHVFEETKVHQSFAAGNVRNYEPEGSTGASFGGLIGTTNYTNVIENCYATGDVIAAGSDNIGGLIGKPDGTTIKNCYATGSLSKGKNTGGLVFPETVGGEGAPFYACTVISSYFDNEDLYIGNELYEYGSGSLITPNPADDELGRTTEEMKSFSTFADAGWDISDNPEGDTIWYINEGITYPLFEYKAKEGRDDEKPNTGGNGGGTGSAIVVEKEESEDDKVKPPGSFVPPSVKEELNSQIQDVKENAVTPTDTQKEPIIAASQILWIMIFLIIAFCVMLFAYRYSKNK